MSQPAEAYADAWAELRGFVQAVKNGDVIIPRDLLAYMDALVPGGDDVHP